GLYQYVHDLGHWKHLVTQYSLLRKNAESIQAYKLGQTTQTWASAISIDAFQAHYQKVARPEFGKSRGVCMSSRSSVGSCRVTGRTDQNGALQLCAESADRADQNTCWVKP